MILLALIKVDPTKRLKGECLTSKSILEYLDPYIYILIPTTASPGKQDSDRDSI